MNAAIVLRPGKQVTAADIIAPVREHKGPVQAPKRVEFVDAAAQNAVGKPDK